MDSRLELAVENLVQHHEAVLNAHGSAGSSTDVLWTNPHDIDIPYAQAIVTGGRRETARQYDEVREFLAGMPDGVAVAVVDVYSELDLEPLGMQKLFATPWLFRESAVTEGGTPEDLQILEVETPAELQEFEITSTEGFDESRDTKVFLDSLLDDRRYRFFLGRHRGEPVSGVVSFDDGQSVGIYTLFTLQHARKRGYGEAMVRSAISTSPERPMATFPSEMSNRLFRRLGFEEIGTRTVWLRPGQDMS